MSAIDKILKSTAHRPWQLPTTEWKYYQEWNKVLFLHWKVNLKLLEAMLPKGLEVDLFEGEAWVSLVPFTMEKLRPRLLPYFPPISDFHEVNLRTYVLKNGKPGVYFLNIEAQKTLSTSLAKLISGLPYEKSKIRREKDNNNRHYYSENTEKQTQLQVSYKVSDAILKKEPLDVWLTERYCLYLAQGKQLIRYEIHHEEWEVNCVNLTSLKVEYSIGALQLTGTPDRTHYSPGIAVVAWGKELA